MSTPFICYRCTVRLAKFRTKQLKPRFRLHTQASAAVTSGSQPIWVPEEQRQRLAVQDDFWVGNATKPPIGSMGSGAQQLQDDAVVKTQPRWDRHITKFTPRRRHLSVNKQHVRGSKDFKAKILGSLGNYYYVYDDIRSFYGLTHEETRHTITQLNRLLWGWDSLDEAATRLDLFHDWKSNFKDILQEREGSTEAETSFDELIMKDTWHRLDQQRRKSLWPQTISSILRMNPSALPRFIQSTFESSWCPNYILEDSIFVLLRIFDKDGTSETRRQQLAELVFFLLENSPPRYIYLEQTVLREVMSWLSTPHVLDLYKALRKVEHPLHWNTSLHFASRFAENPTYKVDAGEVLHSLRSEPRFDINSPAAASVCTTLLNLKEGDRLPGDDAAPDELFKLLLDLGFRPNLLGLSALMRNFCVRGRVEVAWNMFNLLIQRDIQPDAQVFSILLNGAKHALDMESLERIVGVINVSKAWTPYLVNDLLDFIYQVAEYHNKTQKLNRQKRKRISATAWRLMVQIYAKFYQLASLQKLTLFPLENLLVTKTTKETPPHLSQISRLAATLAPLPDYQLMRPDSIALSLMFKAHLRSIDKPNPLKAYYHHFKELLRKDDRTVGNLVKDQGTLIFDIFLRDFLQFSSTVQDGLQIVQEATQQREQHSKNMHHHLLSVYTYTILTNGLRNRRHPRAAVNTLNAMIKRGITPNITTWNAIIGMLLRENHITEAVWVMQHLEQIGLEANDRTVQEISRLSYIKRAKVARLMEDSGEKDVDPADQRSLAKSLLNMLSKRSPELSMKQARKINKQHGEDEESRGEPLL